MPNVFVTAPTFIPTRTKAVWRRRWRRSGRTRGAILVAALALTILPFLLSTHTVFKQWVSNRALAASVATIREGQGIDVMTDKQRLKHAQALHNLVESKPDALLALVSQDILIGFSQPDLQRQEGNLQIWQYRTGECVLDIFFDGSKGGDNNQRVIHYEVRPRQTAYLNERNMNDGTAPDPVHCLRSLKERG
jgi:hypothetical protein